MMELRMPSTLPRAQRWVRAIAFSWPTLALATCLLAVLPLRLTAQEDPGRSPDDSSDVTDTLYTSSIGGEFRPAKGFDLVRTKRASLNISFYGLFRYMNQLPGNQTFTDHLGNERTVKARNDL